MKELKAKRLIKFEGRASSWSSVEEHHRQLAIAKRLDAAGFGQFVNTLKLAPTEKATDDSLKLADCTYYQTDKPTLVTEEEFTAIKKAGAKDLQVIGIYQDDITQWSERFMWVGLVTFCLWNVVAISKLIGLI